MSWKCQLCKTSWSLKGEGTQLGWEAQSKGCARGIASESWRMEACERWVTSLGLAARVVTMLTTPAADADWDRLAANQLEIFSSLKKNIFFSGKKIPNRTPNIPHIALTIKPVSTCRKKISGMTTWKFPGQDHDRFSNRTVSWGLHTLESRKFWRCFCFLKLAFSKSSETLFWNLGVYF